MGLINMLGNINLSRSDLERLILTKPYKEGGEANIYRSDNNTLYKLFLESSDGSFSGMCDNKFQKIKELDKRRLRHSARPINTISYAGNLLGYEMIEYRDYRELTPRMFRRNKIFYLEMIRDILKYYEDNGVIYGDIRPNNILINCFKRDALFIDMDNICIDSYPMDLVCFDVEDFAYDDNMLDIRVHSYMHNLLTLKLLNYSADSYDNILIGIRNGVYPRGFTNIKEILNSMLDKEQFRGEYIIQYVKK